MGGGLLQLVAFGAQDVYLTGNPQITYFKLIYRRYTNFSMESVPQQFSGMADFGSRVTCTISRNADLLSRLYIQATLPALHSSLSSPGRVRWVDKVGHALIQSYELMIGGQSIDIQYGEWLEIWNQLTLPEAKTIGYNRMIGHTNAMHTDATASAYTICVPLQFWFCKNPGLALPLVALQFHDIKINVQFASLSSLIIQQVSTDVFTGSINDMTVYADYIYLDTDERRRFAQAAHEYLIEQVQYNGGETINLTTSKIDMYFNHPIKYFVFVAQKNEYTSTDPNLKLNLNQQFNYTTALQARVNYSTVSGTFDESVEYQDSTGNGPITGVKLVMNGHDRFSTRPGMYFNCVQPYQHFPAVPTSPGIYVYSFGLKPDDAQPSGSCNFSRIDTAVLQLSFDPALFVDSNSLPVTASFRLYAINVNVFRIMSGLGAIAYAN